MTLRDNTEWTETVAIGANRLAGCDPGRILAAACEAMAAEPGWGTPFGAGDAAARIADISDGMIDGHRGIDRAGF